MNSCSVSCPTFRLRFFFVCICLSPLHPGTCARSTDSFLPIISEILPNDSGVILRPSMAKQSSSILIFGTFIMTHSFAICSFRHWFWCGTLLALTPHIQNYLHLNRDLWGLVVHLLFSYHTSLGWIMAHDYYSYSILCTIILLLTPHIQNYLHLNRDLWGLL